MNRHVIEHTAPPERGFRRNPLPVSQGNCFVRMLTAKVIGQLRNMAPISVATGMWPSDRITAEILERASSAPAMTGVAGWAAELTQRLVSDAISIMSGVSAGAEVLRRCLMLALDRNGFLVPGLVVDATGASFVAEGDPIPVHNLATTPGSIPFTKLASIAVLTREMVESSNAEALIGNALGRAAGLALDAVLFSSAAATSAAPAGLRNGIGALTASVNTDPFAAVFEDMATLFNAVGQVGGAGPFVLVAGPGRAITFSMRVGGGAQLSVYPVASSFVGNDLIAIAPQAIAAALGTEPVIEAAKAGVLHMDTAPSASPSAGARKEMYQTDSIAVKMHWPVSWLLRDARGVAWLTPAWK
jgi:hypothetical protein